MKNKIKYLFLTFTLFLFSCNQKTEFYDYEEVIDISRSLEYLCCSYTEERILISFNNGVYTGDFPIYNITENGNEKIELESIGIDKSKILGGEKIVVNYQLKNEPKFPIVGESVLGYIKNIEFIKADVMELSYIKTENGYALKTDNDHDIIEEIFGFDKVVINKLDYIIDAFSYLEDIESNTTLYASYLKDEVVNENGNNYYKIYSLFSFNPLL